LKRSRFSYDGAGGGALAAVVGWNNDARNIDDRKNDGRYLETLQAFEEESWVNNINIEYAYL